MGYPTVKFVNYLIYRNLCKLCVYLNSVCRTLVYRFIASLYFQVIVVLVPSVPVFVWDYRCVSIGP